MSTTMQAHRMLEADNQVGNECGGQQVRLATESPARSLAVDDDVDAKNQDEGESGDWSGLELLVSVEPTGVDTTGVDTPVYMTI